jgi:hypothetical protein
MGLQANTHVNGVRCLTCHTTIYSRTRHDFNSCQCPEETRVSVDGGRDYARRCFGPRARWVELLDDGTEGPPEGPGGSADAPLDA